MRPTLELEKVTLRGAEFMWVPLELLQLGLLGERREARKEAVHFALVQKFCWKGRNKGLR